jgi:hypothetical protein
LYLILEFLIGQLLHVLKRCDLVIQSPKNEAKTLNAYFKKYGLQVLSQVAFGVALFSAILANPHVMGQLWAPLGIFEWNAGASFAAGFIFDNALDWIMERIRQVLNGRTGGANVAAG